MKVLWLSHRDIQHPRAGGAERTIFEISKRLVSRGNTVIWVSVSDKGIYELSSIEGIHIERYGGNIVVHVQTHSIIKKHEPDVIIDDLGHAVPWGSECLTSTPGTVFFRHLHKRSLKGQVSVLLRTVLTTMEKFYPRIYRKWSFVTETESSIKDLESLGICRNRIVKIPPGVDFNLFKPTVKSKIPTMVYFGGYRDYKRPWESLYVLKNLLELKKNINLIMIGSGPSLEPTRTIAKSLGVEQNVNFTGRLSPDELAAIVGSSWVNIHSSITEGFGYSVLESSASGTPTVAYKVPGIRDVIKDGVNGYLVEDGNRVKMSESVIQIIDNFTELSQSSIEEAHNYSWEKTTDLWENHLNQIIAANVRKGKCQSNI